MTPQTQPAQPNLFTVSGHGTEIAYSTTSITGQPHFTFKNAEFNKSFTGDQIRTEDSELGKLVTVSLAITVDTGSTTATLLVPSVDMGTAADRPISTVAIVCKHIGPIAPGHTGARQVYESVVTLHGHAKIVEF